MKRNSVTVTSTESRDLERELARCQAAGAEWERRARKESTRAESLRQELERTRAEHAVIIGKLTDKLIEVANRPPVVIQATETIRELGEAIAKVTGMNQIPGVATNDTGMEHQGLTNDGGVGEKQWLPLNEFDPTMEDEARWPTHGGWWNPQPQPTPPSSPTSGQPTTLMNGVRITEDGPVRTDGQEMFRQGTSAQPPVGGTE